MCAQIHTDFYVKFHYFCPIVTKLTNCMKYCPHFPHYLFFHCT